jgi:hypothetical protein
MKNFNPELNSKNVAEDLPTIKKGDPQAKSLAEELESLDLSEEVKKLLIEGVAQKYTMETGGFTASQYQDKLHRSSVAVPDWVNMMLFKDIHLPENRESHDFIRLTGKDFGFEEGTRIELEQLYKRAEELGVDLCQPVDGLEYRLRDDVHKGEMLDNIGETIIATEPVTNTQGDSILRDKTVLLASAYNSRKDNFSYPQFRGFCMLKAYPSDNKIYPATHWLFRLRKKTKTS